MSKQETSTAHALSGCLATILIMILGTIIKGYTLTFLWRWFVVPVMHVSEISTAASIGICFTIGHFQRFVKPDKEKVKEAEKDLHGALLKSLFISILLPALSLFFGWICHEFMVH